MKKADKELQEKLRGFFIRRPWLHGKDPHGSEGIISDDMYDRLRTRMPLYLDATHWLYLEGFVDGWRAK
jgi:hypothetical protein